jgi:hypothetical protein
MRKFDVPIRGAGTEDDFLMTLSTRLSFRNIINILFSVIVTRKVCKRLNLKFYITLRLDYTEERKGLYLTLNVEKQQGIPIRNVYSFMRFSMSPEIRSRVIAWGRANT